MQHQNADCMHCGPEKWGRIGIVSYQVLVDALPQTLITKSRTLQSGDALILITFSPWNRRESGQSTPWDMMLGNLELPFPFYLGVAESAVHMCRLRDKAAYEKSSQALTRDV